MLDIFTKYNEPENLLANCIRFLTVDAVQNANSGHPGMPMGMADIMTVLYKEFLVFNPNDARWQERDRVVISNGHGCMLLYSLLYLTGYKDITLEDLKQFRQINSKTSGHPEIEMLEGVETSTGPLGQGLANAVGMALSAKISGTRHSQECFNHKIYCTVGDGCLMEGISQEVITFAAHYNLDNLVVIFDDNGISIDGKTSLTTSENQAERFDVAGWEVFNIDGHDVLQIREAFKSIQASKSRKPIFINAKTIIGFGNVSTAGTEAAHGNVMKDEAIAEFKKYAKWSADKFEIPDKLLTQWRGFWKRNQGKYDAKHTNTGGILTPALHQKNTLEKLEEIKKFYHGNPVNISMRRAMNLIIENLGIDNYFLYGTADLSHSVMLKSVNSNAITGKSYRGNYIHFGIREHAMGGICNGIALYGMHRPVCGTFLVFSDYMRPAIRMAAIMKLNVIYAFTHDSVLLGEDGPTHQPVEHLTSLRAIPNVQVFRPCDIIELAECYKIAISSNIPSVFALSRQDLPQLKHDIASYQSDKCSKGAYIVHGFFENPEFCIIATGSEVHIAVEISNKFAEKSINVNVISMPCMEIFEAQADNYKQGILPAGKKIFAIEAGLGVYFDKYTRASGGKFFGVETFGKSGKMQDLQEHFSLTSRAIFESISKLYS